MGSSLGQWRGEGEGEEQQGDLQMTVVISIT